MSLKAPIDDLWPPTKFCVPEIVQPPKAVPPAWERWFEPQGLWMWTTGGHFSLSTLTLSYPPLLLQVSPIWAPHLSAAVSIQHMFQRLQPYTKQGRGWPLLMPPFDCSKGSERAVIDLLLCLHFQDSLSSSFVCKKLHKSSLFSGISAMRMSFFPPLMMVSF